jgi:hypothetical protein
MHYTQPETETLTMEVDFDAGLEADLADFEEEFNAIILPEGEDHFNFGPGDELCPP